MGLKAGWLALFFFVWIIGAFLGSTFDYQITTDTAGMSYTTGTATFTYGSTTVTGAGTAWADATMAGGNIKSNTDGVWCKIQSVTNPTTLVLYAAYPSTGGAGMAYTMAAAPGWAGTSTGGYATSPQTTLEYLTNISNVATRSTVFGVVPMPVPNGEYFSTMFKVITWQWSFMPQDSMFYWIFCAPFVIMGVLCMVLLVYGLITGNL